MIILSPPPSASDDFDLGDALGDPDRKPTPKAPTPKKPSGGFDLEDALPGGGGGGGGGAGEKPGNRPQPNPKPPRPHGDSGGISDSDLADAAGQG
uniref:Uncharacterized protein n=1 Tax=Mus spicilegus TaxID=10103 RepID=A0A8C6GNJ9_MUSSI